MDKKFYKKTRYQGIYYNLKKKNYIINLTRPNVAISKIDGNKIFDIDEAVELRNKLQKEFKKANVKTVCKNTFGELFEKYLEYSNNVDKNSYKRLKKKESQYNNYYQELKNKKINQITESTILSLREKWNCSDSWKNELLETLKAFFNWCRHYDYIIKSPTEFIKKIKIPPKEMKFWSTEEAQQFVKTIENDLTSNNFKTKYIAYTMKIFVLLELNMGNRVGETRALRYCDLDYINNRINIEHSINYDPRIEAFYKEPKNMHSIRPLDVSKSLIEEIKKYRLFIETSLGITIENAYPIIMSLQTFKPYSDTFLRRKFYNYIETAGIKHIRMYDLRHTYASILMCQGWEIYCISKRLGHSSITTTVNVYGHLSSKIKKEVAESTANLF